MSTRTRTTTFTTLLCDRDGGAGDVATVRFSICPPGSRVLAGYEMELCAAHRARLAGDLKPFIIRARTPAPADARTAAGRRRTTAARKRAAGIRAWAEREGLIEPGKRGRIPAAVIRAHEAGHAF